MRFALRAGEICLRRIWQGRLRDRPYKSLSLHRGVGGEKAPFVQNVERAEKMGTFCRKKSIKMEANGKTSLQIAVEKRRKRKKYVQNDDFFWQKSF